MVAGHPSQPRHGNLVESGTELGGEILEPWVREPAETRTGQACWCPEVIDSVGAWRPWRWWDHPGQRVARLSMGWPFYYWTPLVMRSWKPRQWICYIKITALLGCPLMVEYLANVQVLVQSPFRCQMQFHSIIINHLGNTGSLNYTDFQFKFYSTEKKKPSLVIISLLMPLGKHLSVGSYGVGSSKNSNFCSEVQIFNHL